MAIAISAAIGNVLNDCLSTAAETGEANAQERISASMARGEFNTALTGIENLPEEGRNSGEMSYRRGYSLLRVNRPHEARLFLEHARARGFGGFPGWETTDELLKRVELLERLYPPHLTTFPELAVYGRRSPWTEPIIAALPQFVARAKAIFHAVPEISLCIFPSRRDFDLFHQAMFGMPPAHSWEDGTGNAHIVIFCEEGKGGGWSREPGTARTTGDVLHEYGHALCNTIFGDNYLSLVPKWLDEGMADAIAAPYYAECFAYADRLLKDVALKRKPPGYEMLCKDLYSDAEVGYAFARLMVQTITRGDATMIGKIVQQARYERNFASALYRISGMTGEQAYDYVVRKYWSRI
ncbi:MAG TPA: hypothetical protein V6D17_20790 [Candidatus Obscuribacterales bacterium]